MSSSVSVARPISPVNYSPLPRSHVECLVDWLKVIQIETVERDDLTQELEDMAECYDLSLNDAPCRKDVWKLLRSLLRAIDRPVSIDDLPALYKVGMELKSVVALGARCDCPEMFDLVEEMREFFEGDVTAANIYRRYFQYQDVRELRKISSREVLGDRPLTEADFTEGRRAVFSRKDLFDEVRAMVLYYSREQMIEGQGGMIVQHPVAITWKNLPKRYCAYRMEQEESEWVGENDLYQGEYRKVKDEFVPYLAQEIARDLVEELAQEMANHRQ